MKFFANKLVVLAAIAPLAPQAALNVIILALFAHPMLDIAPFAESVGPPNGFLAEQRLVDAE
jgi:hypothetical protein